MRTKEGFGKPPLLAGQQTPLSLRVAAQARASKLKHPDTALVRQDLQRWPNAAQHTQNS